MSVCSTGRWEGSTCCGELPDLPLFISDDHIFCTPEFYQRRLSTAMLRRVATRQIPVLEEPLDGLPVSTRELRDVLRAHHQFK